LPSEEEQATTICNMHRKFGEIWACGFLDMRADRQIDRQTHRETHRQTYRHTDHNISHSAYWERNSNTAVRQASTS